MKVGEYVDKDDFDVLRNFGQFRIRCTKWIVDRRHERAALQVHNSGFFARITGAPLYTAVMSIKFPLDEMTVQEKLAAMESLWEDLSRSPEAIESPAWHKDILDQRQQRIADGTAQFEDWEKARAKIREKVR